MKTVFGIQFGPCVRPPVVGCLITLLLGFVVWPGSAFSQGNNAPLLTTFNNPAPAAFDIFGASVTAVGSDRALIGASGVGAAYLFSFEGTLLTTFTNPTTTGDSFGASLAAVGSDRVLVGAYSLFKGGAQVGAAYLFSTRGTLLTTFTNPNPAAITAFGLTVAALGSDRVIIGAGHGEVLYLFSTSGTLLTTITNPAPAAGDGFGWSVAVLTSDRLLIGTPFDDPVANNEGSAYLFSTNGTLLTSFTNPVAALGDNFGFSVAAVGSDRVLIGSPYDDTGASNAGSAYLFSTDGTLVTTFTNPTPTASEYFGTSVASVGSSRVLISAYRDSTSAPQAGVAYLFSTNGTLLTTFTNPTPADNDWFAWSVAAVGSDRVIIGGGWDDTGATNSGAAYLFGLPYPLLSIARISSTVSVSWVTPETGLVLQQTDLLGMPTAWSYATGSVVSVSGLTNVLQSIVNGTNNRFYRLHRP